MLEYIARRREEGGRAVAANLIYDGFGGVAQHVVVRAGAAGANKQQMQQIVVEGDPLHDGFGGVDHHVVEGDPFPVVNDAARGAAAIPAEVRPAVVGQLAQAAHTGIGWGVCVCRVGCHSPVRWYRQTFD